MNQTQVVSFSLFWSKQAAVFIHAAAPPCSSADKPSVSWSHFLWLSVQILVKQRLGDRKHIFNEETTRLQRQNNSFSNKFTWRISSCLPGVRYRCAPVLFCSNSPPTSCFCLKTSAQRHGAAQPIRTQRPRSQSEHSLREKSRTHAHPVTTPPGCQDRLEIWSMSRQKGEERKLKNK